MGPGVNTIPRSQVVCRKHAVSSWTWFPLQCPLPLFGGKAKGISVAMSNLNMFQCLFYVFNELN